MKEIFMVVKKTVERSLQMSFVLFFHCNLNNGFHLYVFETI